METADDADHDQPDTVVFEVNVGQTGQSARISRFASGVGVSSSGVRVQYRGRNS